MINRKLLKRDNLRDAHLYQLELYTAIINPFRWIWFNQPIDFLPRIKLPVSGPQAQASPTGLIHVFSQSFR